MFKKIREMVDFVKAYRQVSKDAVQLMRNVNGNDEEFADAFRQAGCRITHLSRARILITSPKGGTILLTPEQIIINPTERDFGQS